jgi:DNA-binding response OmpR family regulator
MPRVLVVDDDHTIRALLCMALETDGFEVDCAQDGDQALAILRAAQEPYVVLLDINMPGRSGWDVCAALADPSWTGKRHRVIVMSAALSLPAIPMPIVRHVVHKPFHLAHLLPLVHALADEPDEPSDPPAGDTPAGS